jgi:hypothetical protein
MVDLHSVAASSHPSRHERESEWETTSRSRVGQSRRPRGRTDTTTIMLESQPQPTVGTTASPPAAVGPDAALLAACKLLNNLPPARASPSAAEQWHHDVDRLIIAAINMPHCEGRPQPSAQQSCFPSGARAPMQHRAPMASYQTSDLREEINRHRGGEDSRTTIERNRERHRDIEGRNLKRDFDLHAPVGARQVAHAPLPLAP